MEIFRSGDAELLVGPQGSAGRRLFPGLARHFRFLVAFHASSAFTCHGASSSLGLETIPKSTIFTRSGVVANTRRAAFSYRFCLQSPELDAVKKLLSVFPGDQSSA